MARIAIIVGHARKGTYCEALGEAYARGAKAAGHQASLFVLSRMTFDPILRTGYEAIQPLEPDLDVAEEAIMSADHLVLVFPLWLGTLPAIFKGFLERVLQPRLMASRQAGRFEKMLAGKSVRIVLTMGMPGLLYRYYYGAHTVKFLKRNVLAFLGAGPVRTTIHGSVESVSGQTRGRWLAEAEAMGRLGR